MPEDVTDAEADNLEVDSLEGAGREGDTLAGDRRVGVSRGGVPQREDAGLADARLDELLRAVALAVRQRWEAAVQVVFPRHLPELVASVESMDDSAGSRQQLHRQAEALDALSAGPDLESHSVGPELVVP